MNYNIVELHSSAKKVSFVDVKLREGIQLLHIILPYLWVSLHTHKHTQTHTHFTKVIQWLWKLDTINFWWWLEDQLRKASHLKAHQLVKSGQLWST
jgi:hypothetical protein